MHLFPLLFTVFIDSLGFGFVFPILSPLIMSQELGILDDSISLSTRGLIFGVLASTFCLGQFFGSPLLGSFSDRIGRKKVLLSSIWLGFLGYLFGAVGVLSQSLFLLFLCRLFCGVAAGNYAIAQSVIADLSSQDEKAKKFGLLGMAWGVGFIIGPFLGGKLSDPTVLPFFNLMTPFCFAAVLCLINAVVATRKIKETLSHNLKSKIQLWGALINLKKAFSMPQLRGLFVVMFIFCAGWGFFTEFSPIFLMRYLDFKLSEIANFYAVVGLWIAICQGLLIRPFVKKFSSEFLLSSALFFMGITLPFFLFFNSKTGLYSFLPLLAFAEALIFPSAATIVSNLSSKDVQGESLGIYNSIQWAGIGLAPLFSGSFVALYPHLPITVSAAAMFLAFSIFALIFKINIKKLPAE